MSIKFEPEKQLANLLAFAKRLIEVDIIASKNARSSHTGGISSVFSLIKMLADKIMIGNTMEVIDTEDQYGELYLRGKEKAGTFWYLMTDERISCSSVCLVDNNSKEKPKYCARSLDIENEIVVDLTRASVIPVPWRKMSTFDMIIQICGVNAKPWIEDTDNHIIDMYLPMGICLVRGSNHSITAGMLKKTGEITITKDSKHRIYDISELLDYMRFDGVYYRRIADDTIVCKANNFEFGCIFELGRIIMENNISLTPSKSDSVKTSKEIKESDNEKSALTLQEQKELVQAHFAYLEEKGVRKAKVEIMRNMFSKGLDAETIAEYVMMPVGWVKQQL